MTENEARIQSAKTERAKLEETKRDNRAKHREQARSNRANETLKGTGQMIDLLKIGSDVGGKLAKTAALAANDPSWYAADPGIAKDAASVSFFNPISGPLNLGINPTIVYKKDGELVSRQAPINTANVGFMLTIDVAPTVGTATGVATDPVNVFSRLLYTETRKENAGASNYYPVDQTIYFVLSDSAYSYASHIIRLYGLLNYYTASNLRVPRDVIRVLGYNPDDLILHMADFRMYIRSYLKKLNTRKIPNKYTILARHWQMFSSVYKDANPNTDKCQLYAYRPTGFYTYDVDSNGAGMCKFVPLNAELGSDLTFQDICTYGDRLINGLFLRQDTALMSGDIEKAFGSSVYTAAFPDEDYTVTPVYDEHMLMQIANTKNWNVEVPAENSSPAVGLNLFQTEEGNLKMGTMSLKRPGPDNDTYPMQGCGVVSSNTVLNVASGVSTEPGYILEYTRLAPTVRIGFHESKNYIEQSYIAWGSEIPTKVTVHYLTVDPLDQGTTVLEKQPIDDFMLSNAADGAYTAVYWVEMFGQVIQLAQFDWAPTPIMMIAYLGAQPSNNFVVSQIVGDLQNYTVLAPEILTKMHTAALLSQFAI